MRPDCINITIAKGTGSMNRLRSGILVEANTRKGFLTSDMLEPETDDVRVAVRSHNKKEGVKNL